MPFVVLSNFISLIVSELNKLVQVLNMYSLWQSFLSSNIVSNLRTVPTMIKKHFMRKKQILARDFESQCAARLLKWPLGANLKQTSSFRLKIPKKKKKKT